LVAAVVEVGAKWLGARGVRLGREGARDMAMVIVVALYV